MNLLAQKSIYYSTSYTGYRRYFTPDLSRVTAWLNLTKDEYYYIEVRQANYGGADHLSVAVEIDDTNAVTNHFHT
jgi:predicted glycosyltransferase involved in capsule biosynthesis